MLSHFFAHDWISLHGLVTVLSLATYLIASRSLRQRRHPSAAIAWLLSLALIPYLALPLYFLVGNRKISRPPAAARTVASATENAATPDNPGPLARLQILAGTLGLPPSSSYDAFEVHVDGHQALHSLLTLIDSASTTLDVCTFVLGRDVLGRQIAQHLIQKAQQGVRVRLMIDGLGRYLGGHMRLSELKAAGIKVCLFVSPLTSAFPGRTNLRNHRKLVIADGCRLWIGGRNLAAEYFEGDAKAHPKKTPWVDLTFGLTGAVARQAQDQFNQDWAFATQQQLPVTQAQAKTLSATATATATTAAAFSTVQLVPSGPDQAEDTLYTLLISSCFSAQNRILAVSPYFVPDATLQMALTLAARRGIQVDLLLPRKSNHKMADLARNASLRELTAAGARVWLLPQMIHAKAVVVDDDFALAGTANLDERSLFLNYEMMVAFYKPADVQQFVQWMEQQRVRAHRFKLRPPSVMRDMGEGVVRWLAFQL